jgi:osmotically-inducible protein OsmY
MHTIERNGPHRLRTRLEAPGAACQVQRGRQAMQLTAETRELAMAAAHADEELRQRVKLYLIHTGHMPVRSIDVVVHGGTATLRGMAPTYYIRQLAIACAQRVAGVRQVVDQIRMEQPAEKNHCSSGVSP